MKTNLKYLCIFISVFFLKTVFAGPAKSVYSIVNGASWTNGSHWSLTSGGAACGCTPDESKDDIHIETNTSSSGGRTFGSSVTLHVSNTSTLTINGNSQFDNGSIILVDAGSELIINGNLTNANNSNTITFNGALTVNGNFSGGNGSTIVGTGSMTTTGSATTSGSGAVFGSTGDCPTGPCSGSTGSPLPIELLYFNASAIADKIELKWATATEINNDFFTIERTKDGINFENIVQVDGAGNSTRVLNYAASDDDPYNGISYYHLKQTDFDGKFSYSDLIAVNFDSGNKNALLFDLYPNPSDGNAFNLKVISNNNEQILVVVNDVLGNENYSTIIITKENEDGIFAIDPNHKLLPGVYNITASSNQDIYSKILIVK